MMQLHHIPQKFWQLIRMVGLHKFLKMDYWTQISVFGTGWLAVQSSLKA